MLVVKKKISGFLNISVIFAIILFSGALCASAQVVLVKGANTTERTNNGTKTRPKKVRTRGINLGTDDKQSQGEAAPAQVKTRGVDLGTNSALLPKQMQFPVASPITAAKPSAAAAATTQAKTAVPAAAPAAKKSAKSPMTPGVFTISMPKMGSPMAAAATAEKNPAEVKAAAVKAPEVKAAPKPATPVAAPPAAEKPAVAKTTIPAPPKLVLPALPPPKLSNFGFDVISVDDRGHILGKRVETARYFQVDLPGGMVLDMVQIPGGSFMMGTQESDLALVKQVSSRAVEKKDLNYDLVESYIKRFNWETPQHMVNMPTFYIGKFEITQAQWMAVASLPKVNTDLLSDPSSFKGSNRPVETITWDEANEFCERLTRATGRRFRLPTEAEWEYAARGGTSTAFSFGDSIKTDWANFQGKFPYNNSPKGEFRETTVDVGSLGAPNAYGLYDMHGNVWEWCSDVWNESYEGAPADGKSWDTGKIPYLRIIRGGGWDSFGGECRSTSRNRMTATIRLNNIGLRVVVEIPEQGPIQANLQ